MLDSAAAEAPSGQEQSDTPAAGPAAAPNETAAPPASPVAGAVSDPAADPNPQASSGSSVIPFLDAKIAVDATQIDPQAVAAATSLGGLEKDSKPPADGGDPSTAAPTPSDPTQIAIVPVANVVPVQATPLAPQIPPTPGSDATANPSSALTPASLSVGVAVAAAAAADSPAAALALPANDDKMTPPVDPAAAFTLPATTDKLADRAAATTTDGAAKIAITPDGLAAPENAAGPPAKRTGTDPTSIPVVGKASNPVPNQKGPATVATASDNQDDESEPATGVPKAVDPSTGLPAAVTGKPDHVRFRPVLATAGEDIDRKTAGIGTLDNQAGNTDEVVSTTNLAASGTQSTSGSTTTADPQALAPGATAATVPIAGLAVEIAARAQSGNTRFEIRLDPPELGRIDVRLDIDRSGHVTSRLVVDRPETLDMLQRAAPDLEQALQQAGLKTADSGLQFSLRDQSSGGQNQNPNNPLQPNALALSDDIIAADAVSASYGRMLSLRGGIDIRV
jgi:flagellar hook-length control protein FliK